MHKTPKSLQIHYHIARRQFLPRKKYTKTTMSILQKSQYAIIHLLIHRINPMYTTHSNWNNPNHTNTHQTPDVIWKEICQTKTGKLYTQKRPTENEYIEPPERIKLIKNTEVINKLPHQLEKCTSGTLTQNDTNEAIQPQHNPAL